jgi:hypothetical protein
MTANNDIDLLAEIKERCKPLRVDVKLRKKKDKYFIDFDGSKSYTNIDDWNKYWPSFERWVSYALTFSSFTPITITSNKPATCSVFVGSLFNFLEKAHD